MLWLLRRHDESAGAADEGFEISSGRHSVLSVVIKSFAAFLSQPSCIDILSE